MRRGFQYVLLMALVMAGVYFGISPIVREIGNSMQRSAAMIERPRDFAQ